MPDYLSVAPARLEDAFDTLERKQMISWDSHAKDFVPGANAEENDQRLTSFENSVLMVIVGSELQARRMQATADINATMPSGRRARRRSGRLEP